MNTKHPSLLIVATALSLVALVRPEGDARGAPERHPATPIAPQQSRPPAGAQQSPPAGAQQGAPAADQQQAAVHLDPRHGIDDVINPFSMDHTEKTDAGYVYWFFDKHFAGNGKTLKLSVVHPHQASHAPHHHLQDEFWYVLKGKAAFFIDGKTRIVGPNTGMYAPSNVEHGISNAGDTDLEYLVIQQYPDAVPSR